MIAAGFGFRTGATEASLRDAFDRARGSVVPTIFATEAGKASAPAFLAFAQGGSVSVLAIPKDQLSRFQTLTQSEPSIAKYGTGSVAEASALAALGSDAVLLGPRVVSADRTATCALAERRER